MRFWITLLYLLVIVAYAMRRGDKPERLVGLILFASMVVDRLYHLLVEPSQFVTVDPAHLMIDGSTLAALLWIALRANRGWPLWACAAQNIVMLGHIAKVFELRDVYRGYWVMTQVPILVQMAFLAVGTLAHARRVRRIGSYPSWRLA